MWARRKFTDKHFTKIDNFNTGDREAYKLLVKILDENGYYPAAKKRYINIASIDGLLWRVDNKAVFPDPYSGQPDYNSYDVVHQAFHVLGAIRYGYEYWRRPKICLLIEALAGCSEVYFEAASLKKSHDYDKSLFVRKVMLNSDKLERPFIKRFNKATIHPFETYKKVVNDQMKISLILMDYVKAVQRKKNVSSEKVRKRIQGLDGLIFLNQKPFSSFVSYVASFCGLESNKQDIYDYQECLKILKSSKNMVEFINAIQSTSQA